MHARTCVHECVRGQWGLYPGPSHLTKESWDSLLEEGRLNRGKLAAQVR